MKTYKLRIGGSEEKSVEGGLVKKKKMQIDARMRRERSDLRTYRRKSSNNKANVQVTLNKKHRKTLRRGVAECPGIKKIRAQN